MSGKGTNLDDGMISGNSYHDERERNKCSDFSIINTNARSLCPKISSLIDCMSETDTRLAIITETWLQDGPQLEQDVVDLSAGAGLGMITKNRTLPAANGVTYGGVAVIWQEGQCSLREMKIKNPENYEVLI